MVSGEGGTKRRLCRGPLTVQRAYGSSCHVGKCECARSRFGVIGSERVKFAVDLFLLSVDVLHRS